MFARIKQFLLTVNRPLAAIVFLCLVALLVTGYWLFFVRHIVYTDDARIDGDLSDISPQINGTITNVLVREGERVKRGQTLFILDTRGLEAAAAMSRADAQSARSDLAVKEAELERAVNGPRTNEIQQARARVDRLAADEKFNAAELERLKSLRDKAVMSQSDLDKAQAANDTAHQALQEAEHQLALLLEGTRSEELKAAQSAVELSRSKVVEAEAAIQQAEVNLSYAVVTAPFDGVVVRRWMHPGESILIGQPVVTLLNPATVRISANVEEIDLYRIAIGDRADIAVDSYPDLKLKGKVEKILRATNSKFSIIPSEGVAGTFIKVVQRVPLWIGLENSPDIQLSPGLSVEVHIHTGTADATARGR